MKSFVKMLIILLPLCKIAVIQAQDVVYTQFYANPIYLNPALAGSKLDQRLTLNYRNQWPNVKKGYVSYCAAWDKQFDKLSGGLGVIVTSDIGGDGMYNRLSANGIYSYRFHASRNIVINAALQVGYLQYRLDWDKVVFGDQIDIHTGSLEPTMEYMPAKLNIGNVDFSAGVLGGYKESLYFGLAVNHLSRPDMAFYDGAENKVQLRWTLHSGVLIDFFQGMQGEDLRNFSISPNIIYVQQGNFRQVNAGMYLNLFPYVIGAWMRHTIGNPDAIILLLGFQQKDYKIGYSYDCTLSRLSPKSGGAHEISLAYLFPAHLDQKRFHKMRSPEF
ncbi:MAG: PorP/SprF family type IX secretion system membrane protein [Bacteroidota bacterium]